MTPPPDDARAVPTRREPPRFRRVSVQRTQDLTSRLRRVVLAGPELEGLEITEPAASVRLLLPPAGEDVLVMPEWSGNQFDLPDGRRAPIRTFTPRHLDRETRELTLDVVLHGRGAATEWAATATPGAEVAVSGPGRGYQIDGDATSYLLVGDEVAVPAMSQLLEVIPSEVAVAVHVELTDLAARPPLPDHPTARVLWHHQGDTDEPGDSLVEAVGELHTIPDGVWIAGEAAAVQRIRKHLFGQRRLSRSQATVRGYWKKGRSAT